MYSNLKPAMFSAGETEPNRDEDIRESLIAEKTVIFIALNEEQC
jgi:hypothetical protein